MPNQRLTEATLFGYQLDRVDGTSTQFPRYEVLGPDSRDVIASFPDRPSAEKFILMRELNVAGARLRNPAY